MTNSETDLPPIIAIDPGREKCGLAVVTRGGEVIVREIIQLNDLTMRISHYLGRYGVRNIVLGDRTGSRNVRELIRSAGISNDVAFVDEDRSSEIARKRYLMEHPGKGIARLLPIGLRTPDEPIDDYVAVILAERYLAGWGSTRRKNGKLKVES
jgi:RNase H-fold protein (predicted Holliday junction resolvase)